MNTVNECFYFNVILNEYVKIRELQHNIKILSIQCNLFCEKTQFFIQQWSIVLPIYTLIPTRGKERGAMKRWSRPKLKETSPKVAPR